MNRMDTGKIMRFGIPCLFTIIQYITFLLLIGVVAPVHAHGPIENEPQEIDFSTFPPIEQDVQALANYGNAARQAGQRLVEWGYDALNDLHAALLDPNASFPQKMQTITVLGEIGEAGSVEHILDVANNSPNSRYLYQNTLLALAKFEQTDQVTEFVDQQLVTTSRDPLIQRTALAYYAQQPTADAEQWVNKYAAPDANPDVRYAALYLGGTLGMDSVKQGIVDILQNKQKNTREYYLLLGLAEITTPEEFAQLIDGLELSAGNVSKVKQFNLFRKGDATQKHGLAKVFISKGDSTQKRAAIDYLIENQDAEALARNWQYGDGAVRSAVKRAGYTINVDDHGASFVVVENNKSSFLWIFVFSLSVLLAGFLLWRFYGSDMQKSS